MSKADQTRQLIIEKSAPLFNTKGVAGTSMQDIMKATKLAKGSLYVHFENKEELANQVVDFALGSLLSKTLVTAQQAKSEKEKLISLIDRMSELSNPIGGGCPILNFGMEADDTNPVIRKKVQRIIRRFLQEIKGMVEKGISLREFKKGWDPEMFALKTFALIEGGILLSKVSGHAQYRTQIAHILKNEIEEQSTGI